MAMTAGQFFLYLLIIIILKESLASAASWPAKNLEVPSPTSSVRVVATSELWHAGDSSSMFPAVNMGATNGYPLHAQPAHRFVRGGKVECFARGGCFTMQLGVGQHVVFEYSTRNSCVGDINSEIACL